MLSPVLLVFILGIVSGVIELSSGNLHDEIQSKSFYLQPKRHSRSTVKHNKTLISDEIQVVNKTFKDEESKGRNSSSAGRRLRDDYLQQKPKMTTPPNCPLLPYFVGYMGNSIHAKQFDVVAQVERLAQQIGREIVQPNLMTGAKTLSKFNTMTEILRTMTAEQLKLISEKLYKPFAKIYENKISNSESYQSWTAFRDSVAQAGTGPALLTIIEWIHNDFVKGEEAAELISVLSNTVQHPTKEYMETLFGLTSSEEVMNQKFLNESCILTFSNLLRKVYVNKETARNRFPVHSFGLFVERNDKDVTEKYLTYLSDELVKAVALEDSVRVQVYIRALGNTAHRKIIEIFEPFLEGKHSMSNFQRLVIVASMDKITKTHPDLCRSVLFKLYQNSGESPEMRVAAVMQIMKANPPPEMLQRMAEYTNYDVSKQVVSAVKSAIENAARLTSPQTRQLAENARSAIDLLTTEEHGVHYSKNFLKSYLHEHHPLGYDADMSYIESVDGTIPSSMFYNLRRFMGGLKRQNFQMALMMSSSDDLLNLIFDHISDFPLKRPVNLKDSGSAKWTWEKVSDYFKFEFDSAKEVEGNILFTTLGGRRFFPFDNKTIEQIHNNFKDSSLTFRSGRVFNFTKMYNQHEVTIGFPTEMGLPFVYTFNVPTVVHANGVFQGKAHPDIGLGGKNEILLPLTINVTTNLDVLYSSKSQGKIGFVTPFNHQSYTAELEKNVHFHLPLRVNFNVDLENKGLTSWIEPLNRNIEHKMFEYSTSACTTKRDILDFTPPVEGLDAEKIHIMKSQKFEKSFGQVNTGFSFKVKAEAEQRSLGWGTFYNYLKGHDPLSALLYWTSEQSINNNNFSLTYNPNKSSAKWAKLMISYSSKQDKTNEEMKSSNVTSEDKNKLDDKSSYATDMPERHEKMMKKALFKIKDGKAKLLCASLEFEGPQAVSYVATATYASSLVSENSRFLFWFDKFSNKEKNEIKNFQVSLQIDGKVPKVALMNFNKAMKSDPTTSYEAWLNYGNNSETRIHIQGKMKRSERRLQYLMNHMTSKSCIREMQEGNYIQPDCRNLTANANFLDNFKFKIDYENVPECCKRFIYQIYSSAHYYLYPHNWDNMINLNKEGNIDIEFDFSPNLNYLNISIDSPGIRSQFQNVQLDQLVIPLVIVHPEYNAIERLNQKLFKTQQFPVCAIDGNIITTFDNKAYPMKISKCWTLLVHTEPKPRYAIKDGHMSIKAIHPEVEQISLISRYVGLGSKEFILMIGKHQVHVRPSLSNDTQTIVEVNGKTIELSKSALTRFKDDFNNLLLEMYLLPTGSIRIKEEKTGMEIIYNGQQIKLQMTNSFRNQMRGLCGNFDSEQVNDFMSPGNCIFRNPIDFISSYTIKEESCKSKNEVEEIEKLACVKQSTIYSDIVNDNDAESSFQKDKVTGSMNSAGLKTCTSHRVKTIKEQSGQACFSLRPQITCSSHCKPTNTINKTIDFHCISDNIAAKKWEGMVKKGGNPDFSDKGANLRATISLPERCVL